MDKKDRADIWGPIVGFLGGLGIMAIVFLPIIEEYTKWNRTEKAWEEHMEHVHFVSDTTLIEWTRLD